MNDEIAELRQKLDQLSKRLTEAERKGASNLTEGVNAVMSALGHRIDELEAKVKRLEAQMQAVHVP